MPLSGTTREEIMTRPTRQDLDPDFPGPPGWIEAFAHVLEHWRRLALWTIVALVLTAGIAYFLCKFSATTQIMPPESSAGSGLAAMLPMMSRSNSVLLPALGSDLLGIKSTGALFVKVLQSETVLNNQVDRFDLMNRYHMSQRWQAREKLLARTEISEDKKSGVITVSYRDRDPVAAQQIANGYVEELNKVLARVSTSAARREREFIEQRLSDEKQSLNQAEQQFSNFASSSMAPDVPEQTRVMVEAAARLQGELIAARGELQSLEQIYAPENPRVKSLRARIGELQRALSKLNTGTGTSDGTNPYPSVSKLPSLGVQWTNLYREAKIHETIYEMLTQQYESARIQEAKEIPTAKVLDFATLPERRTPAPWIVITLGGLFGLLLATAGLLLQRWWTLLPSSATPRLFWAVIRRQRRVTAWK